MAIDPREESDGRVPPQPKTAQFAAPEKSELLLAELKALMVGNFAEVKVRLDSQDGVLARVVNEGVRTNTRLDRIEHRVDEVETRMGRASTGVRGLSQTDLAHEAQLAAEKTAREALAKQVDGLTVTQEVQLAILSRLDKLAANPLVKAVVAMALTALVAWLATHGGVPVAR